MPIATIDWLYCVSAASGIDGGVLSQLAFLTQTAPDLESIKTAVASVPGLLGAIDLARQDPDDLYITSDTISGLNRAVWPAGGVTHPIQATQAVPVGISIPFELVLNVSLWDHDLLSGDDLLGSVQIFPTDVALGPIARPAFSLVEASAYYVVFHVS